ncbi:MULTISPECIES: bacterial surface protein [unclassified Paenibacillus]|uniref:bacterial surface protein n=1 Tax=unclassified Paenibacillus TaxID=185978 RepID=UPI00240580AB|nr:MULTISPECIES: bacterial surface protein [unclassified Paenibacillus]MDF9845469.1 hypothetical protein [Paenibacillus sp. PastF-2]MDF9852053.1 hypothetical protein [Paenibacillus sp. PastM-2]MDF9858628.1 hypothetical protein [Paenibacillus sp. PastF-1]MDH6483894.1 hypothetical protein [Paenibacillus sp. PastH-2]MDH6511263.1 hypothetical protein [Paenibacillus sp. PastM-3]
MKSWKKKLGFCGLILIIAISFFGIQKNTFAATVGSSQLLKPETGWTRIIDSNPLITYMGTWTKYTWSGYSTGSATAAISDGASASFWFKGDKLRVLGTRNTNKSKNMKIQIDDTTYTFNVYGNPQADTLLFEKTGLDNANHQVTLIYNKETSEDFVLSAFDISDGGSLIPEPTATPTPSPTVAPTTTPAPTVTPTNEPTVTPEPIATPSPTPDQSTGNRAILIVTMNTGLEKEFDLSMDEVNAFIRWYENKQAGTGTASYAIDKQDNNKGPFSSRKDYMIFDKILTFSVDEYSAE